jgi:hypothetical protein
MGQELFVEASRAIEDLRKALDSISNPRIERGK